MEVLLTGCNEYNRNISRFASIRIIYCIRNTGDAVLKIVSKVLHFVNLAHFLFFVRNPFNSLEFISKLHALFMNYIK